jgi:hypothetical protein
MNKRKRGYFTHNYTPSNKKKKEEMEKAVKVFHACVIANRIKKFMEYDFMADNPTING